MKIKGLLNTLIIAGGIAVASFVLYPTGSPGGKTGSPGDGGANCTGCHSGAAQQVGGWITSNIPASGYMPGQNYTVTATANSSSAARFGFEVTSENSTNNKVGTINITDAAQTQKVNSNKSITHTVNGTTPSGESKSWSFDWTAPASGTGTVKFYGAFNAANGDGTVNGDQIYLSILTVNEATTSITENVAGSVDVKVYPNPFLNNLEISAGKLDSPVKSIFIISQDGRMVYNRNIQIGSQDKIRVDASHFSEGIYIVTVQFEDRSKASYKIVKE